MSEIYENGSEITIKSENQNSLKCDSMSNKDFAASFCLGHNQSLSGYKMTLSPLTSSKSYDNLQRMSKIASSNFDCITHSNSKPTAIVVDATSNQSSVISHSAKPSTSAPACNSKLVAHHLISETHQDLVQRYIVSSCCFRFNALSLSVLENTCHFLTRPKFDS